MKESSLVEAPKRKESRSSRPREKSISILSEASIVNQVRPNEEEPRNRPVFSNIGIMTPFFMVEEKEYGVERAIREVESGASRGTKTLLSTFTSSFSPNSSRETVESEA